MMKTKKLFVLSDGSTLFVFKKGFNSIRNKKVFNATDVFSEMNLKRSNHKQPLRSHKKYQKKYT